MRPPAFLLALFLFAGPEVVLPEGARLHLKPDVSSPCLTMIDEEVAVSPLEERDGWVLVRHGGFRGWVRKGPPSSLVEARDGPNPPIEAVLRTLVDEGRALLSNGGREFVLDRRRLLTDVPDEDFPRRFTRTVIGARPRFDSRWKWRVRPGSLPASAVFLFGTPESELAFSPVACGRAGVQGARVVALSVAGDPDRTLDRLLHQVGHLRALEMLGDDVPPWLEEGLADAFVEGGRSLGRSAWARSPLPKPEPSTGVPTPTLAEVLEPGSGHFARDAKGKALRRESIVLFRYLSDRGGPRKKELRDEGDLTEFQVDEGLDLSGRFRGFIWAGIEGKPLGARALSTAMGQELPALERGLRAYEARYEKE